MGVTIGYAGTFDEELLPEELGDILGAIARDQGWGIRPLELAPEAARVGPETLHRPRIKGVALLPHAASDPLPFLIEPTTRTLLDSYAHHSGDEAVTLSQGPLVNVHFGGTEIHEEICRMLHRLREECFSDLVVDDETGYFATESDADLARGYEKAWRILRRGVEELLAEGARHFEVAGFGFHLDERQAAAEFDLLEAEERRFIEELDAALQTDPGLLCTAFDEEILGAPALDRMASRTDEQEERRPDPEDPEMVLLAHELGAAFGRLLVANLAGHWMKDDEGNLFLGNVGGTGLRVDPFQIAARRILIGPEHAFERHLRLFESFREHLHDL